MDNKIPFLVNGLQRTGTNYTEALIKLNFKDVDHVNDGYSRMLPTHKHFRLYDEKWVAPEMKYLNNFYYPSYKDFNDHLEKILGYKDVPVIVMIKNPYSWYQSYKIHANRNKYVIYKDFVNSHFMIDYMLYYKKWLEFSEEAPDKVMIMQYESVIKDLDAALERYRLHLNAEKAFESYQNVEKVAMSRKFNMKRMKYYKKNKYIDLLTDEEKHVINHILEPDVIKKLGYEML